MSTLNNKRREFAASATPVPLNLTAQLDAVAQELLLLADSAIHEDIRFSSKRMMQSYSGSSRNKPRRPQPPARPTPPSTN